MIPRQLIVAWCLAIIAYLPGTSQQHTFSSELAFYADVMVHAARPEHRMRAADSFYLLFKDQLQHAESLSAMYRELPWIMTISPEDSSFQIITWQVLEEETARYYGFIRFPGGTEPLELLHTRTLRSELAAYDQATWYGALYYGIQSFKTSEGELAWVLLGFNAADATRNQRVADVLTLSGAQVRFGLPVFESPHAGDEPKSRILLEYADAASATMRFDRERQMVVYDHVMPIQTPQGPALVPDGSYHGYVYRKGFWHFVDDIFENAPHTPPPDNNREQTKRDLFGRETDKRE